MNGTLKAPFGHVAPSIDAFVVVINNLLEIDNAVLVGTRDEVLAHPGLDVDSSLTAGDGKDHVTTPVLMDGDNCLSTQLSAMLSQQPPCGCLHSQRCVYASLPEGDHMCSA